jgi:outer membrane murein-binding lipoprotein Lpp
MDVFTMVVAIVAISSVAGTIRHLVKLRASAPVDKALQEEVEALKARVAQLEAIVTDPRHRLAAELDALGERG